MNKILSWHSSDFATQHFYQLIHCSILDILPLFVKSTLKASHAQSEPLSTESSFWDYIFHCQHDPNMSRQRLNSPEFWLQTGVLSQSYTLLKDSSMTFNGVKQLVCQLCMFLAEHYITDWLPCYRTIFGLRVSVSATSLTFCLLIAWLLPIAWPWLCLLI